MAFSLSPLHAVIVAVVSVFGFLALQPIQHAITVVGVFRSVKNGVGTATQELVTIKDTVHCEDLHHHVSSNTLFAACEDDMKSRFTWFPPLVTFAEPLQTQGSIHAIDPTTMKSTRLKFTNFKGAFISHGIDVIPDPTKKDAVYIYAVNHLPSPRYFQKPCASNPSKCKVDPKARSQVELFHHVLGSGTIQHVRSAWHPLIVTPNDVYGQSPNSFFVTNDHHYREGLIRTVEDLVTAAKWSTTIHVQMTDLKVKDGALALNASVALTGIHNNNGLGHGQTPDEILVTSAMSGIMYRGVMGGRGAGAEKTMIKVIDEVAVDCTIDNPSYFADPYASDAHDASGYILSGLLRAADLAKTKTDPKGKDGVMTYYIPAQPLGGKKKMVPRLIFEDDGSRIRSSSAGVLVPIKPESKSARRQAWLFVTGFMSENMIAVKVDL